MNSQPATICEMCAMSCKDAGASVSLPVAFHHAPAGKDKVPPQVAPKPLAKPRVNPDTKRQKTLMEDGLNLINQIRVSGRVVSTATSAQTGFL